LKKAFLFSIILMLVLVITSCSSGGNNSSPSISNANSSPKMSINPKRVMFDPPSQVSASDTLITEGKLDENNGWSIYKNSGDKTLLIFDTDDKGKTWTKSSLPVTWELNAPKEYIFPSFKPKASGQDNWILITSDPAAGQMLKTLFKSDKDRKVWTTVGDLSTIIEGYPTGISFRDNQYGWLTATHHSTILVPLYRTIDGGKSWNLQPISIPDGYKYGNAFPPIFSSKAPSKGTLLIEFVGEEKTTKLNFVTIDGGESWKKSN
jgi:photosystem II stability/assembly factor-like uncharacterized protein